MSSLEAPLRRDRDIATREAAAQQRPDHAQAVGGGQLLALGEAARPVANGHLEDPLAALQQTSRDLRLDREAGSMQGEVAEEVGAQRLVAGHQVLQVDVEE